MKELLFIWLVLSILYILYIVSRIISYLIFKSEIYTFLEYVFWEEDYQEIHSLLFIIFLVIQGLALSIILSNVIISLLGIKF